MLSSSLFLFPLPQDWGRGPGVRVDTVKVSNCCGSAPTVKTRLNSETRREEIDNSQVLTIILVIMVLERRFEIVYAPEVKSHLRAIERKHYALIRNEIEAQLQDEPDVETRNRKPLKRPVAFEAEWEIRFGPSNRFRVFYEIDQEQGEVYILAIGIKERNRLYIGGKEVEV